MPVDPHHPRQLWLSLIIPTFGRTHELQACLRSIAESPHEGVEILIVDQNLDDRLQALLCHFQPGLPIRHLRQQIPNASVARNLGAHNAKAQWIGFPDDDCKFLPETLPNLRERILTDKAALLILRSVQPNGLPSGVLGYNHPVPINNQTIRSVVAEYALYLPRDLFLSVNGFDPQFGPGGIFPADEGIDLIRRLQRSQTQATSMIYCPDIKIAHPQNLPYIDRASLKKAYRYAQGRGACFARHWKTASKRRALTVLAKAFASPLLFRGPRRWLGPVNLLGCLRGFIRYHTTTRIP